MSATNNTLPQWKHRLLLVDDEEPVLAALKRCLRNESYRIDTFSDPVAALEQSRKTAYDLILSDYRMPKLDGVMLLSYIRQLQPQSVRLILSAYTDTQALLEAINQAQIHRFVQKPWEAGVLRLQIAQALEYGERHLL